MDSILAIILLVKQLVAKFATNTNGAKFITGSVVALTMFLDHKTENELEQAIKM